MDLRIFDVEHGACALVEAPNRGRIALIDCGTNRDTGWTPADFIRTRLGRDRVDYLIITNADQDHYANLARLKEQIQITTLHRNWSLSPADLEALKLRTAPLSADARAYKALSETHVHPVPVPFNEGMSGVQLKVFCNSYPEFEDTNNLSLAAFVSYFGFQILFPGDLEKRGWRALLARPDFRAELHKTTILVASHHGRENGFCAEVFQNWGPRGVVVSDKPVMYASQETVPQYQNCLIGDGILVQGQDRRRHVLTTRRDGCIHFRVDTTGTFWVFTS